MNRTRLTVFHTLLTAILVLTGALPALPAQASASRATPPTEAVSDVLHAGYTIARAPGENAEGSPEASSDAQSSATAAQAGRATLDGAIDPGPWDQAHPSAVTDSSGTTYAVWEDYRGASPHIRFAERPNRGNWQPSLRLDPTGSGDQTSPRIAADSNGNLYAIWEDYRGAQSQIYFAHRPAGGDWGVSEPISPTVEEQDYLSLAVNRRGQAVVAWRQKLPSDDNGVFCAVRSASGDWSPAEQVSGLMDDVPTPDVAIDDWGQVYVAWETWDPGHIRFAMRSPDGSWSPLEHVRDTAVGERRGPLDVKIAVDGEGNVHAVWDDRRSADTHHQIYAAYRPVGGSWSTNVRIDDGDGDTVSPGLTIDGAGNVVAAWTELWTDVYGAVHYLGSGWTPSQPFVSVDASLRGKTASAHRALRMHPQFMISYDIVIVYDPATGLYGIIFIDPLTNVSMQYLPSPGYYPCTNLNPGGATMNQTLSPQAPTQGGFDPCRGGNGGQQPALSVDEGFIGPPGPEFAGAPDPASLDLWSPFGMGEGSWPDPAVGGVPWGSTPLDPLLDYGNPFQLQSQADYYYSIGNTGMGDLYSDIGRGATSNLAWDPASQTFYQSPQWQQGTAPTLYNVIDAVDGLTPEEKDKLLDAAQNDSEAASLLFGPISTTSSGEAGTAVGGGGSSTWTPVIDAVLTVAGDVASILEAIPGLSRYLPGVGWALAFGQAVYQEHVMPQTDASGRPISLPLQQPPDIVFILPGFNTVTLDQSPPPSGPGYDALNPRALDPVLLHSGEFVWTETLLSIPGRGLDYTFQLSYHSQLVHDGPLGWGWEHSYDRRIVPTGGGSLALKEGNGRFDVYTFDGTGYTPPAGRYTTIVSTTAGITITNRHGHIQGFYPLDGSAAEGRLRTIADRNGNTLQFAYDDQGHLQTVTDTLGRDIDYTYDNDGHITAVNDFAGRAVTLDYDANGDLVSITTPAVTGTSHGNDFPLGKTTVFSYTSGFDDLRLNHNLTTIISPNEMEDSSRIPRTVNTYGEEGLELDRIVHQSWGGGRSNASGIPAGGDVTLVYTTAIKADAPAGAASKTTVNDRGGNVIELWHDGAGHRLRQHQVVAGKSLITDYAYNNDGQRTSITYPAGNRIEYTYNEGAADRFAQGNLLERRRIADGDRGCDGAGGTPCPDLVTAYAYEPTFQQLQTITDSLGNVTTYSYDSDGNQIGREFPTVTVGPAAPQTASESWTYNTHGQALTFTDPEGNVICHTYYESGPAEGYRQSVTYDCGGTDLTTEYEYDPLGNVTVITDARDIRTEYEVNALNQVVRVTRAEAVPMMGPDALRLTRYGEDVRREDVARNLAILDYETLYTYDANDNLVRVDVENVTPDLDSDGHPTGTHSRDGANPWLSTEYTYDLLDSRVRVTQDVGTSSRITTERRYDPLENPTSVTDPEGNWTEYTYDERNLMTTVTVGAGSPEATTNTSHYDANGNLVRRTDGEGRSTDFFYDGFDRRVGRVDPLGNVRTWAYDGNSNLVQTALRDGQNGRNPMRTITATAPVTLTHVVNAFDERNRRYNREQAFFSTDVDTGVITPITTDGDRDAWVEAITTYDRNGNVTAMTDDNGHVTTYAYDGLDRLARRTDALGDTVTYTYDGSGNLIQTVVTEHQPDDLVAAETFTTTSAFDALDRLVMTSDSLGQTARYAYDSRDNRVFTSDANGPPTDTRSSDFGRLTAKAVTTAASNDHGNTALFAYDGLNRLTQETYHLRQGGTGAGTIVGEVTTSYAYDGNGNLTHRTDPNDNVTAYAYDALDRLTTITYADGTSEALTYDRAHNLVERTDANGSVIAHTYDDLNRRIRTDVARAPGVGGTTLQTFAYDGLSRLVATSDENGSASLSLSSSLNSPTDPGDDSSLAFGYDSLSNRITETQDGHAVTATFDGEGNRITLTYPGGTALTTTYDELNRVSAVADGSGTIANYDYVGPWRLHRRTNANGTYTAYTYDGARRVTEIAHRKSSDDALLTGFTYTYDRVDNQTSETAQHSGETTIYSYDSLYRLTDAEGPDGDLSYTYDDAGNRVRVTEDGAAIVYTKNQMHEYTEVAGETRTHDANGNLLSRCFISTPQETWSVYLPLILREPTVLGWTEGPLLTEPAEPAHLRSSRIARSGDSQSPSPLPRHQVASRSSSNETDTTIETLTTYRYDADNRLLKVTEVITATGDGDVDVTSRAVRYTYDATGRLISTQADGETVRYLYAGRHVIEERDEGDALLTTYVTDLIMDREGVRWFYQTDALGSVRALVDETGPVAERVNYDPFGAPVISGVGLGQEASPNQGETSSEQSETWPTMSAMGNPYLFRGRRYDAESGLYVYGGRRYDPEKGRYLQWGGDTFGNPYTFAGNNPLGGRR